MLKTLFLAILFSSIYSFASVKAGEVYKTEESDGNVKYTNVKPVNSDEKVLETKNYRHPETSESVEDTDYPEYIEEKIEEEKQNYLDEVFRKRAKLLYEKEKSLKNSIKNTKVYIDDLENVIEDYLVNGYFADNYIFELRVQESNLESLKADLLDVDNEWYQLKKDARKNSIDPGVLRVK